MRFYVNGNSPREEFLRKMLREKGHEVTANGPWRAVFLAFPRSSLPPKEVVGQFTPGQLLICGILRPQEEAFCKEKGWVLKPILKDELYAADNACLSAEGAVYFAMNQLDRALRGAKCVVCGYGRIGKALTRMLRAFDASVTVAARRIESREEAGKGSVSFDALCPVLKEADVVFNTVPSPVIGRKELLSLKHDALLMELASAPYGIDAKAADELGLAVCLESGIPGRYCSRSAAALMMDYLDREGIFHE